MASEWATALGSRIRDLRMAAGRSQGELSDASHLHGPGWARSTVAAIEAGNRTLTAEELVVLPLLLMDLCGRPVSLHEVLPEGVQGLFSGYAYDARLVQRLLAGEPAASRKTYGPDLVPPGESTSTPPAREELLTALADALGVKNEAEMAQVLRAAGPGELPSLAGRGEQFDRRAARVLSVAVEDVQEAAQVLYGHRLIDERDVREVAAQQAGAADPRTTGARRGHITRELLGEVREHLGVEDI